MMTSACFGFVIHAYTFPVLLQEVMEMTSHLDLNLASCKDGFDLEKKLNHYVKEVLEIQDTFVHFLEPQIVVGIMIEQDDTVRDLQIAIKRAETIKFILETVFGLSDEPRVKFLQ